MLRYIIYSIWIFIPCLSSATTFNIVPDRPLPAEIPEHGKVPAYYLITNQTNTTLNNSFVATLPNNVTQVSCDPQFCEKTFNLGPIGSKTDHCILKLTVKGPVNSNNPPPLSVCTQNQSQCDNASVPLNVALGPKASFIGIAAGTYNTQSAFFPMIVSTTDNGITWEYPRAILDNLKVTIDPNFTFGLLRAAACTGSLDESVCIGAGSYCLTNDCSQQAPLIALGTKNNTNWSYPHSVFTDLNKKIDPDITRGFLTGADCVGYAKNAFCIASGVYLNTTSQNPLLALSSNGGADWTYPKTIFKNLTTSIDSSYASGILNSASCNQSVCDSVCIAVGSFCSGAPCQQQLPLLALSVDKGKTWIYPHSIFKDLDIKIDPNLVAADFSGGSCTGEGATTVCVAAGRSFNNPTILPILALTMDGGSTWSYPPQIFSNLPTVIGHDFTNGFFRTASCTGVSAKARCIAAGAFTTSQGLEQPLLALTKDGGNTWSYPPFIYTKLKTLVDPNVRQASFNGSTCIDSGKQSICMAAGKYCTDKTCGKSAPLIAVTLDGGKTWQYPPSVFQNLSAKIDPNLTQAFFSKVHCTGSQQYAFCVASGQYSTPNATYPLVAYSMDQGQTWIYPAYVFQNLTTTIQPDFIGGVMNGAGSTGGSFLK